MCCMRLCPRKIVRISIRDLVADGKSLVRNSGVGVGGEDLILICNRRMPPCAVKTCAVRPVFARVVGELRTADPSNVQGPVKQIAGPGEQSEAPRRRQKPGQEQNPGPENQDSQHMPEQPRGHFPEIRTTVYPCSRNEYFGKYGVSSFPQTRSPYPPPPHRKALLT